MRLCLRTVCGSTAASAVGAGLVVLGVTGWSAIANAEDASAKKHGVTVVTLSEGPGSDAVASALVSKLPSPYAQGDSAAFRGAVGPGAVRAAFIEGAVKHKDKDADFVARMRATAKRVHVDRVLVVRTEKGKGKEACHLWMIDAQGSGPAEFDEDVHVAAGASADDEASAAWSAVESNFPASSESAPAAPLAAAPPSSANSASTGSSPSSSSSSSSGASPGGAPAAGAPGSAGRFGERGHRRGAGRRHHALHGQLGRPHARPTTSRPSVSTSSAARATSLTSTAAPPRCVPTTCSSRPRCRSRATSIPWRR